MMLRSWTGILFLTSDEIYLRSLIDLLELPSTVKGASWARDAVFELLYDVLHVVKSQDLR